MNPKTENSPHSSRIPRHTVRVVTQRTGLSAHVLRAWERRYEAVNPARTSGGQRVYSDSDVERLSWLSRAVRHGRRIGDVVGLDAAELTRVVEEDDAQARRGSGVDRLERDAEDVASSDFLIEPALRLVTRLEGSRLEHMLERASIRWGAAPFLERLIAPLMVRVGEAWHSGHISPAHEHLASAVARRVVGRIVGAAPRESGAPLFVAATPAGHLHEIGALLAAAIAASEGWGVLYLGADLPAVDVAAASAQVGARAVGMSAVYTSDKAGLLEEMRTLHGLLTPGTALWVGGSAAGELREELASLGAVAIESLGELRRRLDAESGRNAARTSGG